jgi:hypothetical protein
MGWWTIMARTVLAGIAAMAECSNGSWYAPRGAAAARQKQGKAKGLVVELWKDVWYDSYINL